MSNIRQNEIQADTIPMRIVTTIAEAEGVDPTELDPPIYDVIDPEALAALFQTPGNTTDSTEGGVIFPYNGYKVHVTNSRDISIQDIDEPNEDV